MAARRTFAAAYPHDGLEADLPGQVPLQIPLEALHLGGVMLVVVGGVVVDAPCRVPGNAAWQRDRNPTCSVSLMQQGKHTSCIQRLASRLH